METGDLHEASWVPRSLKDVGGDWKPPRRWGRHTTGWAVLGSTHKGDLLSFNWGSWESGWKPCTGLFQSWPPAEGHGPPFLPPPRSLGKTVSIEGQLWGSCSLPGQGSSCWVIPKTYFEIKVEGLWEYPSLSLFRHAGNLEQEPQMGQERAPRRVHNSGTSCLFPGSFPQRCVERESFGSESTEILNARKLW